MHLISLSSPPPPPPPFFPPASVISHPFFLFLREISLGPGLPGEKEVKLSMGDIPSCNILSAIMLWHSYIHMKRKKKEERWYCVGIYCHALALVHTHTHTDSKLAFLFVYYNKRPQKDIHSWQINCTMPTCISSQTNSHANRYHVHIFTLNVNTLSRNVTVR